VYWWAGDPRTVDMSKAHHLWPAESIVASSPSVYGAIARDGFLRDMRLDQFAARLGEHWGDVNVLHAFRERNTRSQRAFFSQLAEQAGHTLDGTYPSSAIGSSTPPATDPSAAR
jgi:cell filamentation protein